MLVLALSSTALADDTTVDPQIVNVPIECTEFWSIPGGPQSPAVWEAMLSFGACIQDASVYRIDHAAQLPGLVEQLQRALDPAIQFYVTAMNEAPEHVKVRAAYAIGLGQVALMTRARVSLAAPHLRDPLEELLEPHARLAYLIFTAIDRAVTADPGLAPDEVNRNIARSSRAMTAVLRTRWARETMYLTASF